MNSFKLGKDPFIEFYVELFDLIERQECQEVWLKEPVKPHDAIDTRESILKDWMTKNELMSNLRKAFPREFDSKVLRKRSHISSYKVDLQHFAEPEQLNKRENKAKSKQDPQYEV